MKVRPIDVLRNIENHKDYWSFEDYKMPKSEADVVVKALSLLIEKESTADVDSGQK